jgi:fatty acid-binding protein DegV
VIRVIVDGTVDFIPGFNKNKVIVVPLYTIINNEPKKVSDKEFYSLLKRKGAIIKTSQPSAGDFIKIYNKYKKDDLIVITVGKKLSGTYNSAVSAKKMSKRENITVIDSMIGGAGLSLMANTALELIKNKKSYKQAINGVKKLIGRAKVYFFANNLDYLIKGGRIGGALGLLGKLVNLKPILEIANGEVKPAGKMLLFNDLINGFYNFIKNKIPDSEEICIIHNNNEKNAQILKKMLNKYKVTIITPLNRALSAHIGPECLAVAWMEK